MSGFTAVGNDLARSDMAERLEAAFRKVQAERMQGVPILNPRLAVEAVGARTTNDGWLTVLITPWFINLILLPSTPSQGAAWQQLAIGAKTTHVFPAGRFEFISGDETGLGRYRMCSLFSPVLEFEDQAAARLTAEASLAALFDQAHAAADEPAADVDGPPMRVDPTIAAVPEAPTRRSLFLGRAATARPGKP